MDIKKELKQLNSSKNFGNDIVENIKHQKEELERKLHLFQILSLADKLEDAVSTNFFKKDSIEFICLIRDKNDYNENKIDFHLYNKNKEVHEWIKNNRFTDHGKFLDKIFTELEGFKLDFVSEEIINKNSEAATLELKPGIKEKIIDLFLSKELRTILSFNKIDLDLSNNKTVSRKHKL